MTNDNDLIRRGAVLAELPKHANGTTMLGGQSYRSMTLEVALEAIRAIPAVAASPVLTCTERDGFGRPTDPAQPHVAASQPADPARVMVKPLVWQFESGEVQVATSSAWHQYRIIFDRRATRGAWMWFSCGQWVGCETEDDAKAAAQADYEARILAAIDVQPDPRDAQIAALVEAGSWLSVCAQTTGGTSGRDVDLVNAISSWTAALAAVKGGDA